MSRFCFRGPGFRSGQGPSGRSLPQPGGLKLFQYQLLKISHIAAFDFLISILLVHVSAILVSNVIIHIVVYHDFFPVDF